MEGKVLKTEQSTQRLSSMRSGTESQDFMCGTEMSYLSPSHLANWAIKGNNIIQTERVSYLVLNRDSF